MKIQEIGIIGLGKMGFPLAQSMADHGFQVTAFDTSSDSMQAIEKENINTASSIEKLTQTFTNRKAIWLMIPAGNAVDAVIEELIPLLSTGDIIIDGGNSNFNDTLRRATLLEEKGIDFLDCGTSGGVSGARHGACTMIGGKPDVFAFCESLFKAISVENGYAYCGKSGSGHYVKMIHNGIEYGMMQAIAEGFEMLERSEFDMDLAAVAKVWQHGSVIRSWLMDLTHNALTKDPHLDNIRGIMNASGEGQWTVETAIQQHISTPIIALSLMMRYRSQMDDTFSGKIVAALRNEFGGHAVVKK